MADLRKIQGKKAQGEGNIMVYLVLAIAVAAIIGYVAYYVFVILPAKAVPILPEDLAVNSKACAQYKDIPETYCLQIRTVTLAGLKQGANCEYLSDSFNITKADKRCDEVQVANWIKSECVNKNYKDSY